MCVLALKSVRQKLMASFSPEMASKINGLKARIRVGKPASATILASSGGPNAQAVANLHQAFLNLSALSISYRNADGRRTQRIIQPHYLLLCPPLWYVLAWDELRDDARTFRCDRIVNGTLREERGFRLLPFHRFAASVRGIETI
jgi:predicted DNA-binding transcriptional regulator YafY